MMRQNADVLPARLEERGKTIWALRKRVWSRGQKLGEPEESAQGIVVGTGRPDLFRGAELAVLIWSQPQLAAKKLAEVPGCAVSLSAQQRKVVTAQQRMATHTLFAQLPDFS